MREFGSEADWFWVEFLVYYDQSVIRAFGYVRRQDGTDIADGVYQARDDLGERGWVWTKRSGVWQSGFGRDGPGNPASSPMSDMEIFVRRDKPA